MLAVGQRILRSARHTEQLSHELLSVLHPSRPKSFPLFSRLISTASVQKQRDDEAAAHNLQNVTVVGLGLMGAGIAQVAAQNSFHVTVVDEQDEYLQRGMVMIRKSLDRITKKKFPNEPKGAEKFIDDTLSKVTISRNILKSVEDADLVIEAITENIEAKQTLFRKLDEIAPPKTIFASNTSSFSVTELAKVTERQDRFGGLHFFNPVPLMSLVEVVRIQETSAATFNALFQFSRELGKSPVTCNDTPGFIVNRLLVPYMMEAVRMLERGEATSSDIDKAMKLGAGYPMGPFELLDYVGLDTTKYIVDGWHEIYPGNPLFYPSETLNKLVEEGHFGRKTGAGFYHYKTANGK